MSAGYTLDQDEKIIRTFRRHWVDFVPVGIAVTVLIGVTIAISFLLGRYGEFSLGTSIASVILPISALIGVLALLIALAGYYVYRQNYLVLTDLHLIVVEQKGLFSRRVAQLSLARVQDVKGVRKGVIATLLNYGRVEVQSAGEQDEFNFVNAPNPTAIADLCLHQHEEFVKRFPERG